MIFDKEETKNLLNMLRSTDKENATVAFEALKGVDRTKYVGELIVLYKYGKHNARQWMDNCPECAPVIIDALKEYTVNEGENISSGSCLSAMTTKIASKESIELFMEVFTETMVGFLEQMGYPTEKFEINVKIK